MVLVSFFINVVSNSRCWVLTLYVHITNCSIGIRNAWHSYYVLVLVFKVICCGFSIALLTFQQGPISQEKI